MDLPPTVVGSNLDVCVMEGDGVCRSIGYVTVEPRPMDALPSNDSEGSRVSGSLSCQSTGCIEGEICGDDGVCHPGAVDATTTPLVGPPATGVAPPDKAPPAEPAPTETLPPPATETCRESGCPEGQECGADGKCQAVIAVDAPEVSCVSDMDCVSGERCLGGECVADESSGEEAPSAAEGSDDVPPVPVPDAGDEPVVLTLDQRDDFGLVKIHYELPENVAEARLYGPLNRKPGDDGCARQDERFLLVQESGSEMNEGSPRFNNDYLPLNPHECRSDEDCPESQTRFSRSTPRCALDLTGREDRSGDLYTRSHLKTFKVALSVKRAVGGLWETRFESVTMPTPGIECDRAEIPPTTGRLKVNVHCSVTRVARPPVVPAGCRMEGWAEGSSDGEFRVSCPALSRKKDIRLAAQGVGRDNRSVQTIKVVLKDPVGTPALSLGEDQAGQCDRDDPGNAGALTYPGCKGAVDMRWELERGCDILAIHEGSGGALSLPSQGDRARVQGRKIGGGVARLFQSATVYYWLRDVTAWTEENGDGVFIDNSRWVPQAAYPGTSGFLNNVPRDHERQQWKVVIADFDGNTWESNTVASYYVSEFAMFTGMYAPYLGAGQGNAPDFADIDAEREAWNRALNGEEEAYLYGLEGTADGFACRYFTDSGDASEACDIDGCSGFLTDYPYVHTAYSFIINARHLKSITSDCEGRFYKDGEVFDTRRLKDDYGPMQLEFRGATRQTERPLNMTCRFMASGVEGRSWHWASEINHCHSTLLDHNHDGITDP